jgi:YidC/Oxa1 family membrane protein insertase
MHDQNNVFFAIALSVVVLITWQYFFATSFPGKPATTRTSQIGVVASGPGMIRPQTQAIATPTTSIPAAQSQPFSRQQALARSQRVAIDTPRLRGSIALTGGRIDDLALVQYRETADPKSPAIELLSPSGSPQPFYAEFGWVRCFQRQSEGAHLGDGLASAGLGQSWRGTPSHAGLAKWPRAGIQADNFGR